jgi:hypothetical protein
MGGSLQKRIDSHIRTIFAARSGAWLVWCDPQRVWWPLLEKVSSDQRLGSFPLLQIDEETAGVFGSPAARARLQEQIDAGASFVLYVPIAANNLGWLWAQALLAERIYTARCAASCWTGAGARTSLTT